jgi:hypothetical protein
MTDKVVTKRKCEELNLNDHLHSYVQPSEHYPLIALTNSQSKFI